MRTAGFQQAFRGSSTMIPHFVFQHQYVVRHSNYWVLLFDLAAGASDNPDTIGGPRSCFDETSQIDRVF